LLGITAKRGLINITVVSVQIERKNYIGMTTNLWPDLPDH
jgi:hypothetical protein